MSVKPGLPFHMDRRAQAAALADLPESVAREAGEFYANYCPAGRRWDQVPKSEAMQHAWQEVIRPYLLGLRDHHEEQRRPEGIDPVRDLAAHLTAFRLGIASGPVPKEKA